MERTGYRQTRTSELTDRQRQVLEFIARGKTNGEIAAELGITLDGAKWHVREILAKLGVDSREDAARAWQQEQTLGARLARRFSLAPLTIGVGAGAAVVIVAVAMIVAFAIGQDGNGEPPASPDETPVAGLSPTLSPGSQETPPPATPPATLTPEEEDFLALARDVETELRQGSVELVNSRAELEHVVCTEEHYPPQGVAPYPCEFVGDEFDYFVIDTGTHGVRERVEPGGPGPGAHLLLYDEDETDGFGPGYPRVIAIGGDEPGGDSMSMMVTRIIPGGPGRPMNGEAGRPPSRQVSVLEWERIEDEWRLISISHPPMGIEAIAEVTRESLRGQDGRTWHEVNALECPTESSFDPRPDIAGQRIGPVTVRLPSLAPTEGVELRDLGDERYATELQMYIAAPEGSRVMIEGVVPHTDLSVSFSHPGDAPAADATRLANFTLAGSMYGDSTPESVATVHGDLVTTGHGCHQVWVTVDGQRHGPFGLMAW